jgi:hypothetical protein
LRVEPSATTVEQNEHCDYEKFPAKAAPGVSSMGLEMTCRCQNLVQATKRSQLVLLSASGHVTHGGWLSISKSGGVEEDVDYSKRRSMNLSCASSVYASSVADPHAVF